MATTAQILANRLNSRKSTGPKTDEGKAAVSQNAVKHGLFAESVIEGENEADYEAFHDKMLAEQEQSTPVQAIPITINDNQDETATSKAEEQVDLKKQSQFAPALMGVTPFVKGGYSNKPAGGDDENKAN
jgi:hypothetical protein